MSLWRSIISQTAYSPVKLLLFGGVCLAGTYALGEMFTAFMAPAEEKLRATAGRGTSFDEKRFASAREQRLSSMIKDMADGKVDQHWNAAMRGTIMPHPQPENKTRGIDIESAAKR